MFLFDAIKNTKSTEPFWFKVIRFLSAAAFSLAFISYLWSVISAFGEALYIPNIDFTEKFSAINYPGMNICRRGVTETGEETNTNGFNVTCDLQSTQPNPACPNFVNQTIDGCWKFYPPTGYTNRPNMTNPISKPTEYLKFFLNEVTNSSNNNSTNNSRYYYTLVFDSFYINSQTSFEFHTQSTPFEIDKSPYDIQYNMMTLDSGQWIQIEYLVTVHHTYYSSHLQGQLGVKPDKTWLEFSTNVRFMPRLSDSSKAIFFLQPKIHYIRYEKETYTNNVLNSISRLGGFYSATAGIFVLLFGAARFAPWGITQKYIFRCWFFRRSFKEHLARRYISAAGIPFGERLAERPEGVSLEARVQILETLLKDYYVETYYLDTLKPTRERYLAQERRHANLENLTELENLVVENWTEASLPDTSNKRTIEIHVQEIGLFISECFLACYGHCRFFKFVGVLEGRLVRCEFLP
ncbi:12675_t:CDS:2 [Ambispora gerdemannii]|uniref:12675_t:CDS:1 n=1 Tax=Ambispora gerdemannii TaxID=144530 RepID=A0A9N8Z6I4_9GLOM|nr:12675_t:CDS:2 [Ambispora gerdemannii]